MNPIYSNLFINRRINFAGKKSGNNACSKPLRQQDNSDVNTSIFYLSDLHSIPEMMDSIKIKSDAFDKTMTDADKFKLSAGDMKVGIGAELNDLAMKFASIIGIELSAIGNHELDCGVAKFKEQIDKLYEFANRFKSSKFRYVATNLVIDKDSPLFQSIQERKIVTSCVMKKNGHDYGFIGAVPTNLKESINQSSNLVGLKSKDLKSTIKALQKEINDLRAKQNINKIILLSHLGYEDDKIVAKSVSGIDVIVGGHSHTILKGTDHKNIFISPDKEPVVIVQAGQNGDYTGILNLVFDSKGIIKSAENNVTKNTPQKDPAIQSLKDMFLGKNVVIGKLSEEYEPVNKLSCENPLANLFADAIRHKSGADTALLMGRGILAENGLKKGDITTRDIQNLIPFKNAIFKTELSGQKIIDILEWGLARKEPGLAPIQVSGLKYTISNSDKLLDVFQECQDGSLIRLNPAKKYSLAYDDHMINIVHKSNNKGLLKLLQQKKSNEPGWDNSTALIEYIKSFNNKPFKLEPQNRISFKA